MRLRISSQEPTSALIRSFVSTLDAGFASDERTWYDERVRLAHDVERGGLDGGFKNHTCSRIQRVEASGDDGEAEGRVGAGCEGRVESGLLQQSGDDAGQPSTLREAKYSTGSRSAVKVYRP